MSRFLLVCFGGALGSGARYLVATWALSAFGPAFPRGTLIVNVVGSFAIGAIMSASLASAAVGPDLRLFLTAGVLGGFTTYSSFNYETLAMLDGGRLGAAAAYLAMTVLGCLAFGAGGIVLGRWVAGA